jgi:hypothetical protein
MTSTRRYADSPKRRIAAGWLALLAIIVVALVAGGFWAWNRHVEMAVAEAQAWTIKGPPCPALTKQAYLAGAVHATQSTQLGDITFERAFGHVSCNFIANDGGRGVGDYPVCQFTSPAVLHIVTPKGEFWFFPSTGPATVSVLHGQAQCVMAANWRGEP